MAVNYQELIVGATAYPAGPSISTVPSGASGYFAGWEPLFHRYRLVAGSSGCDVMFSFDGKADAGRIPFAPPEQGGIVLPMDYPVSYKQVWLRSANGITGTAAIGLYTKQ